VDADGQHDPAAVAAFLALGRDRPGAVIAGEPRFDASAPASRRYLHRVSNFFVWVSTRSLDIQDSLCGFRLYPLEPTLALMDRESIPERMDFDTEIIVRLHWAGVPVRSAPVAVTYPEDGVSHFRPWLDTLLISWMHCRLVFGMPTRLLRHRRGRP